MKLMDCTLRDGGNVVGRGFNAELTKIMIEGLIASNITTIEMGNCTGIGSYEASNSIAPCTDIEYLELVQPYLDKAEIGMFMGWKNGTEKNVGLAKKYGLNFLRVGANAGDGKYACDAIKRVKEAGLVCRYSLMKAYVLSPEELAEEAAMLAGMVWVNIGVRRGWSKYTKESAGTGEGSNILLPKEERSSLGTSKISSDVANNLAFQLAIVLLCMIVGKTLFTLLAKVPIESFANVMEQIPALLYGIVGAFIVWFVMGKTKTQDYADLPTIKIIGGVALEICVCSLHADV